ncbi:MAG: hypothetical protein LBL64_02405 [Treponema sp.]|jgi:hypothetical protein|nr:hypothetical protein [Treponema sp.]
MSGNSLLNLLPPVLRARDYRLYTRGGKDRTEGRIVDLWQAGGRAIMGHTPHLVLRDLKNTANRGLFSPLPHVLEGRLVKALGRLIAGRNFRFYSSFPANPGGIAMPSPLPDPAFNPKLQGEVSLWRPFLEEAPLSSVPVLLPVLPGASFFPLWVTASLPGPVEKNLPPGDLIPPVVLAAVLRALNDLIASPERGRADFPGIRKTLPESPWLMRGIYLSLREAADGERWEKFFRRFLEGGFLIPPGPAEPLILPGELSPGEEAALVSLLRFRP